MGKPTGKSVIERVRVFAAVGRLVYLLLAGVDQSQAPDDGGQTMRSGPYFGRLRDFGYAGWGL